MMMSDLIFSDSNVLSTSLIIPLIPLPGGKFQQITDTQTQNLHYARFTNIKIRS